MSSTPSSLNKQATNELTIFYCFVRVGEDKRHSCAVRGLRGVGEGEGEAVQGGGQLDRGQHAVPALLSRLPACLHTHQDRPAARRDYNIGLTK